MSFRSTLLLFVTVCLVPVAHAGKEATTRIPLEGWELTVAPYSEPIKIVDRAVPVPLIDQATRYSDDKTLKDPGYKETYSEKVVVLEDVVNDTDAPLQSKAYEIKEKSKTFGCSSARQSGDFSGELNAKFTVLTGAFGPAQEPEKRGDWEKRQLNGGMTTGSSTYPQSEVQSGFGMVRYLRLWRLARREERSIGEGKNRKNGWREIVRTGYCSGVIVYPAYSQRFDPAQANLVTFRSPAEESVIGKQFQLRTTNAAETGELSFKGDRFTWTHEGRTETGTFTYDNICGRIVATTDQGTVYKAVHDKSFGSVCWNGKSYRTKRTPTSTSVKSL